MEVKLRILLKNVTTFTVIESRCISNNIRNDDLNAQVEKKIKFIYLKRCEIIHAKLK